MPSNAVHLAPAFALTEALVPVARNVFFESVKRANSFSGEALKSLLERWVSSYCSSRCGFGSRGPIVSASQVKFYSGTRAVFAPPYSATYSNCQGQWKGQGIILARHVLGTIYAGGSFLPTSKSQPGGHQPSRQVCRPAGPVLASAAALWLRFDPVMSCNLRCQMCYFSDPDLPRKIPGGSTLARLSALPRLFSLGRATLSRVWDGTYHLQRFRRYSCAGQEVQGPMLGMVTNGQLLTAEHLEEPGGPGADELTLSTHGVDATLTSA